MKISKVLINGEPSDGKIAVTDSSVLRGDGCFEVIRAYRGRPFCLDEHLDRLELSAEMLDLELPERDDLAAWVEQCAEEFRDSAIRVVVTRGSSVPGVSSEQQVIVFAHDPATPTTPARLATVLAPWHGAGAEWSLAGAKTISYAANMAATRTARSAGFDDALLMSREGAVLEGPTFSVGWVVDGTIHTPALDLGILDSITRRLVFTLAADLDLEVVEVRAAIDQVADAEEVLAFSTIREVQPVVAVDGFEFEPGPITAQLASGFHDLVRA